MNLATALLVNTANLLITRGAAFHSETRSLPVLLLSP